MAVFLIILFFLFLKVLRRVYKHKSKSNGFNLSMKLPVYWHFSKLSAEKK